MNKAPRSWKDLEPTPEQLTELTAGSDSVVTPATSAKAPRARKPRQRGGKVGRPTKQTPETRDRLIKAASMGYASLSSIARAAGVSTDTLARMRSADAKLDEDIDSAREGALDRIEAGVLAFALEDPRVALSVLKARRAAYGDRKVEITGANGGPLQHAVLAQLPTMTDDALAAAVRALEAVISNEVATQTVAEEEGAE